MPKDIVTIETTLPTNFSSENVCNDVHIDVIQIALNKFASNNEIPAIIGLLIEKKIKTFSFQYVRLFLGSIPNSSIFRYRVLSLIPSDLAVLRRL